MSYLEPILVHPVRRQNFGDAVAQTCNPHLIPCLVQCIVHKCKVAFVNSFFFLIETRMFVSEYFIRQASSSHHQIVIWICF